MSSEAYSLFKIVIGAFISKIGMIKENFDPISTSEYTNERFPPKFLLIIWETWSPRPRPDWLID